MKNLWIKIVISILVIYLIGVGVFTILSFPNTMIGNTDRSFVRRENVFDRDYVDRELLIVGRNNKTDRLTAKVIGYQETVKPDFTLDQNAFLWPLAFFQTDTYNPEYDVTYRQQQLEDFIAQSKLTEGEQAPVDAKVVYENGKYVISPEREGDMLNRKEATERIIESFMRDDKEIQLEDSYLKPQITKENPELVKKRDDLNEIHVLKIEFDFGEDHEVLEGDQLLDLYNISESGYIANRDLVHEYVRQLAIRYDTFGIDRTFKPTGLSEITVPGGIYGWQIDVETSTDLLVTKLNNKESGLLELSYLNEGLTKGRNDIGNTYIEVDITRQHLWYYKEGKLITDSPIVTGDPNRGVPTSVGVEKVWSKEKDRNLVGINPEGSGDYSSFVDFWMPVNWNNVGIHNSRWRTEFGGSVYNGRGSFGCINTPYEPAQLIYQNVEINTPVVIYKS